MAPGIRVPDITGVVVGTPARDEMGSKELPCGVEAAEAIRCGPLGTLVNRLSVAMAAAVFGGRAVAIDMLREPEATSRAGAAAVTVDVVVNALMEVMVVYK
jgi:hypothetical protein